MQGLLRIAYWLCVASVVNITMMPRYGLADDIQRTLNWAINTAPPFHIVQGAYQDQGICDALMHAVEDTLPNYQTSRTLMPQTRIGVMFERDTNQCFPCMIYRPYDAQQRTVLSAPTHRYQPHGIIALPRVAARMREQFGDPVPLHLLLESNDFRFGQPAGRQYGALQPLLNLHEGTSSYRVLRTGEYATVAILDMILAGRIDYTLDYHTLVRYHQRTGQGELEFVEVAETQGQHVLGAIGCTNNAWGRDMIATINQNIDEIRQHPTFLQSLGLWFDSPAAVATGEQLEN